MDDKLELQERTTAPVEWWRKKEHPLSVIVADDWWRKKEHPLSVIVADDCLIDPVDAYTARYAFSSGEWDHKIYTFEGQSREEAIKLCRYPIPAMEEDRRMLYGEVWFGNAYYPLKDKYADTYMKPYQSKEEITRLLRLAETQEKDCVAHDLRAKLMDIEQKYRGTDDERLAMAVTSIKGMMEKLAVPIESQFVYDEFKPFQGKSKPSRIDKLEESLTAALSRIEKLEEEVAFLKTNSKLLTLAVKNAIKFKGLFQEAAPSCSHGFPKDTCPTDEPTVIQTV